MATTKIWPIHDNLKRVVNYAGNPEKTEWDDLKQTLHYAEKENKTSSTDEKFCFVTGVNCNAKTAFEEMTAVKNRFGKAGGNVAYHGYQSFKPGEVTPEQCHELGVKLAQKLWGRKYQVLVATHLDKGHLHNHLVINSVSFINGKKFNDDMKAYYEMRRVSDLLCEQTQLSVIKNPKGKTPRSIYFAEKNGEPTKYNLMREAVDKAISMSYDRADFEKMLRLFGYVINAPENRKYATICEIGSSKPTRLYRLGDRYTIEGINEGLRNNGKIVRFNQPMYQSKAVLPFKTYQYRGCFSKARKIAGLKALYFHYCYLLGIYPKNRIRKPLSPFMRQELRKLDMYSAQVRLIVKENLNTTDDVAALIDSKNQQIDTLTGQRNKIYNRLRRCNDTDEISQLKSQRDQLTKELSSLRKDIKTTQQIQVSEPKMKKNIRAEHQIQSVYRNEIATKNRSQRSFER